MVVNVAILERNKERAENQRKTGVHLWVRAVNEKDKKKLST